MVAQKHNLAVLELRDGNTYVSPKRLLFLKGLATKYPAFAKKLVGFSYSQGERSAIRGLVEAAFEVAQAFPNLKRFRLHASNHYTEGALTITPFRKLSAAGGDVRAGLASLSASYMTHLHFDGDLSVKLSVLRSIGKLFLELRSVIFSNVESPSDSDMSELLRDSFNYVAYLPRLQEFEAKVQTSDLRKGATKAISTMFFSLIKQSPQLKTLALRGGTSPRHVYRREEFEKIQLFSAINTWPGGWAGLRHTSLEKMVLQGFSLEYSLLHNQGEWHMPNLKEVQAPDCVVIQNTGLVALMKGHAE